MFYPPTNYFNGTSYSAYIVVLFCLGVLMFLQYSSWFKNINYIIRRWRIKKELLAMQKYKMLNCSSPTNKLELMSPTDIGFILSKEEVRIENPHITSIRTDKGQPSPCNGDNKSSVESLSFRCGSDTGSWLVVKYERDPSKKLGLPWILWHYKANLSDQCDTYININKKNNGTFPMDHSEQGTFKTNGLSITVLEPFRRWRIVFNGMMRNIRNGKVHHVRINLIWSSLSSPYEWKPCTPTDQLVDSLSNIEYFDNFLKEGDKSEALQSVVDCVYPQGYDQWGAAFGKVLFDTTDNNDLISNEDQGNVEEIDIYYRGLRTRNACRINNFRNVV